ncbi:zinc-ribbon domain-containing protein [Paenarthrobacter sp. DKR-5]|uniref:zinc-ribbon domain-containing protein n=1 Tax=Paenarthrobacter sp. DKR-5 TaxID=2835535 RepID=UPI001BDC66C4|nr:zinc-ribbon domain-containing protein [Paenarthrobacter sp. DKR-5]MBT1001658.1 zinc-ribbon domain-containing protein [Paenarthrobacter sp. DKR-5]
MILLFGFRTIYRRLFARPDRCRNCGQYVPQELLERATKFSVFFIPLFTISRNYETRCSNCGYGFPVSRREKETMSY